MSSTPANHSLKAAKEAKKDEFYTQLCDIERELKHYREHFRDKIVYCNCDDPRVSNFFKYFSYNFEQLGLKKLIATCYKSQHRDLFSQNDSERAIGLEYTGMKDPDGRVPDPEDIGVRLLDGDGDFRSAESIELLEQADIVVTNPPFSLLREYVAQLIKYDKKFLIIGSTNAITYKDVFQLIKDNRVWLGHNSGGMEFGMPDYSALGKTDWVDEDGQKWRKMGNTCWFTNLDVSKRHEDLILYKSYNPTDYPTYDNFDAIEVGKTKEIPVDYAGVMGVPISFMNKYNPDQFEIVGITDRGNEHGLKTKKYTNIDVPNPGDLNRRAAIRLGDGSYKQTFAKILIRSRLA